MILRLEQLFIKDRIIKDKKPKMVIFRGFRSDSEYVLYSEYTRDYNHYGLGFDNPYYAIILKMAEI